MIQDFIRAASVFQRPEGLAKLLEAYRQNWTMHELFNNPKLKPFKEAWQAAVFGLGYEERTQQPVEVRICEPEPFPDFQVRVAGKVHEFESRLVTLKRLGQEYRGDQRRGPQKVAKPRNLPPFDPAPIRKAVQRKASKKYSGKVNLLLYVSFPAANVNYEDVAQAVSDGGAGTFESVWVVTSAHIYCPHPSPLLARCDGWLKLPIESMVEE